MDKTTEEEYQEFIVKRCTSVINSCITIDQLFNALIYCNMFRNVYYGIDEIWSDIRNAYYDKFLELRATG